MVDEGQHLTLERLPPVEPCWSIARAFPPLGNRWVTPSIEPLPTVSGEPADASSPEPKDAAGDEADEKDELDIEGDPIPRMFETVVIENTPLYNLDVPLLDPWSGNIEMGLDGSSGNSNTFNVRLGAKAKRKTKRHSFMMDLDYHKNTNDGVETANRLYIEGRYEKLNQTKPWTWYIQETTDYDEFQPWNVRVVGTTGFGYRLRDDKITSMTVRLGAGCMQEVGGPDQDCVPEMNYGLEYSHQMTRRQKVNMSADYYPDVTCYDHCRVVSKADWEVLLDAEMNLSLKLSIIDRYNYPNPGGKLNDIDYAIVLLWSF